MSLDQNHEKTPVPIPSHCLAPDGGAGRGSGELAKHAVLPSITGQLLPDTRVVTHGRSHNKVGYCSVSHLKESNFQSKDLSRAAGLSLRRDFRHTIARVRAVLDAPPPKSSTVASCG